MNPRTECGCQPVAFMIAALVTPPGCRSSPRIVAVLLSLLVPFSFAGGAFAPLGVYRSMIGVWPASDSTQLTRDKMLDGLTIAALPTRRPARGAGAGTEPWTRSAGDQAARSLAALG